MSIHKLRTRVGNKGKKPIPELELQRQKLMELRKQEINKLAQLRRERLIANEQLVLTREQLCNNVSQIIVMHIKEAQRLIPEPTECAKLFHEYNFIRHRWTVYTANGYSSTMPFFTYHLEKLDYEEY